MKRKVVIVIFLFLINFNFIYPLIIKIYGRNFYLNLHKEWRLIARIWPDMYSFKRGYDFLGFRLSNVGKEFKKYLDFEIYTLKKIERRIESERTVYIQGIKFNELTTDRIINNTIQYQRNLIAEKDGFAIHFRFYSYDLNSFKRNLDEFNIIVANFIRQNFIGNN